MRCMLTGGKHGQVFSWRVDGGQRRTYFRKLGRRIAANDHLDGSCTTSRLAAHMYRCRTMLV